MANNFPIYEVPSGASGNSGILNTQSASGDILGALAAGIGGNLAGNAINYGFNSLMQQQQFENQKQLQDRAFQHNQFAVQNQARMQALGMQNAGLSAAQVNGSGAPALQAGAAAGGTSAMTNVFSGIADLIAAIKAPTEIEKSVAETQKAQAETGSLIPAQVSNLLSGADKLAEEVRAARNSNDWLEAQNRFLKEQSPAIFDNRIAQLKASGQWDNLPPETRKTLERLSRGDSGIQLGIGEIEALDKVIASQKNISDADKQIIENTRDIMTAYYQITDDKIMSAIAALPLNQQNLMKSEIAEYYALASKAKSETDLNRLNEWITKHTNDQWLIEHGMSEEIERNKYIDLFNQVLRFPSAVMNMIPAATAGAVAGAAARGSAASSPPVDTRGLYKYFK